MTILLVQQDRIRGGRSRQRPRPPRRLSVCTALLATLCGGTQAVQAQTDEIQIYNAEITAPGGLNLTWHNNFTASGRTEPAFSGGIAPDHALNGVPEWAYGVTSWFEAGLYLPVYTLTHDGSLLFDGAKLRALFVTPQAHDRTFFYGINFEISYNEPHWDPRRWAAEIRGILGLHLGRFDLIFNPIVDTGFDGVGNLEFVPALRAAWNASHRLTLALEEYADFGPVRQFEPREAQSHILFAVVDYGTGDNGVEFGVGRGLTPASDEWVIKLMLTRNL